MVSARRYMHAVACGLLGIGMAELICHCDGTANLRDTDGSEAFIVLQLSEHCSWGHASPFVPMLFLQGSYGSHQCILFCLARPR